MSKMGFNGGRDKGEGVATLLTTTLDHRQQRAPDKPLRPTDRLALGVLDESSRKYSDTHLLKRENRIYLRGISTDAGSQQAVHQVVH
jgi:hypothetical protein